MCLVLQYYFALMVVSCCSLPLLLFLVVACGVVEVIDVFSVPDVAG